MLLTIAILVGAALSPVQADTIRREAIELEVARLVRSDTVPGPPGECTVQVVGFYTKDAPTLPILGDFMQRHERLLWYLASHTPGAFPRMVPLGEDPRPVRDSIFEALRSNDAFMSGLSRMLAQFWGPRGRVVAGVPAIGARPTIPVSHLSALGARFFYPDRFSERGDTMYTHICAGVNGLADFPGDVDPMLEAFTFAAVNRAVLAPSSAPMSDYDVPAARAKLVSRGKDPSTRIRRAQGAMWMQMEQSAAMRRAIVEAYARSGGVLPFRIGRGK